MRALQKAYIAILNPIFEYGTSRLDERVRDRIVSVCAFVLAVYFPLFHSEKIQLIFNNDTKQHLLGSFVLAIIIVFSVKDKLKTVEWNKKFCTVYFLSGLGIFAAGCLHPIGNGYRPFSMMMLVGFPCLYFVWNNRKDYKNFYNKLARAIALVGLAYFFICLIFVPPFGTEGFEAGRYRGTTINPNYIGMMGTAVINASLYLLLQDIKRKGRFVAAAVSNIVLIFLSVSRTSIITAAISIIVWGVICFRQKERAGSLQSGAGKRVSSAKKKVNRQMLIILCIILLILLAILVANLLGNQGETSLLDTLLYRFSDDGKTLDSFSSGRIEVWQSYWKNLNLLGHDYSKIDLNDPNGIRLLHAHNCFLEFSHRCGVPVGLLYLIMETMAVIYAVKSISRCDGHERKYLPFPIFFIMSFYVSSMIEIQVLPFNRMLTLYFFLSLMNVFEAPEKAENPAAGQNGTEEILRRRRRRRRRSYRYAERKGVRP